MEHDGLLFGTLMALAVGLGTLLGIVLTCWVYDRAKRHYGVHGAPKAQAERTGQPAMKKTSAILGVPPLWGSTTYTFTETRDDSKNTTNPPRRHRRSTATR